MRLTLAIIIVAVAMFFLQVMVPGFTSALALTPAEAVSGAWWQFVTYIFLHGDPMHIFLNLFVLVIFGPLVERELGWKNYLILFLLCGIGSAFFHILLAGISYIPLIGASGSVFGILTAYGFLYPRNIILMFPGIPMPAILAVFVFAGLELFFGVFGLEPGIANFGHLGGIVIGILFMVFWKWDHRRKKTMKLGDFEWFWE